MTDLHDKEKGINEHSTQEEKDEYKRYIGKLKDTEEKGKRIEYPLLKRELNLNCKLSWEDIEKIHLLLEQGNKKTFIAKELGVNRSTIYYYLNPKYRKRIQDWMKKHGSKYYLNASHYQLYGKKHHQRKLELQGKEFRAFDNEAHKNYRKTKSI